MLPNWCLRPSQWPLAARRALIRALVVQVAAPPVVARALTRRVASVLVALSAVVVAVAVAAGSPVVVVVVVAAGSPVVVVVTAERIKTAEAPVAASASLSPSLTLLLRSSLGAMAARVATFMAPAVAVAVVRALVEAAAAVAAMASVVVEAVAVAAQGLVVAAQPAAMVPAALVAPAAIPPGQ
jgi:hypothetical protein